MKTIKHEGFSTVLSLVVIALLIVSSFFVIGKNNQNKTEEKTENLILLEDAKSKITLKLEEIKTVLASDLTEDQKKNKIDQIFVEVKNIISESEITKGSEEEGMLLSIQKDILILEEAI